MSRARAQAAEPFRVAPLDAAHDRAAFSSGAVPLDNYLRQQASQDIRRRVASCFVALTPDSAIAGYYTLATAGLLLADLPPDLRKKLPRYPTVPVVRMGRLAVGAQFKGHGLGGALLADALARCLRSDIAAYAMVVDAKDESAKAFYLHHGFIAAPEAAMLLMLPLAVAVELKK